MTVLLQTEPSPLPFVDATPLSTRTHLSEKGLAMFHSFKPLSQFCGHLCGFHRYANNANRQLKVDHFCSHVNEEMQQCIIFDNNSSQAKIVGIEYVISKHLYDQLPAEEKRYWHSHLYEVKSGLLTSMGVPQVVEDQQMKDFFVQSYGKTWHLWQTDRGDALPIGPANLMTSFFNDGEIDPNLVVERDREYGVSTLDLAKRRANLEGPPIDPASLILMK